MNISKQTIVYCLVVIVAAAVLFLTRNSLFAPPKLKPDEGNQLEVPITNNYSFSEIRKFQPFQAKLLGKATGDFLNKKTGKTNYFVGIILEKVSGEDLFVSDNYNPSQNLLPLVNALEKGRTYTFPDVLMSATNDSPARVH